MRRHECFEELCALAAGGQISAEENREFMEHLADCAECRSQYGEFQALLGHQLPLAHHTLRHIPALLRIKDVRGRQERFRERARAEGIVFSERLEKVSPAWELWRLMPNWSLFAVAAVAVIFVSFALFYRTSGIHVPVEVRQNNPNEAVLAEQFSAANARNAALNAEITREREQSAEKARTIAALQAARAAGEGRLADLSRSLESSRSSLAEARQMNDHVGQQFVESSRLLAQATSELEKLRRAHLESDATIIAQQARIQELSEQIRIQTATLDMQRQLVAAGKDIRDLMGARSLHIVDVHDSDGRGREKRTFGRVFFTEGKSLIFYAFDLNEKKVRNANYSFQVWGEREGSKSSARSLGLFYADSQSAKRWVLTVDDPNLLKEIDAVFVTVEPPGGNKRPTGDPFLYAFLKSQANHP